jgi:starvation-inducible DNA-binding protein
MSKDQPVVHGLRVLLANTFTLYLKTHKYHWNVTGKDFYTLHLFFENQYQELWAATDEIAERLRALDAYAPGSYSEFAQLTTLQEGATTLSASEMLQALLVDQLAIIQSAEHLIKQAEAHNDPGTADFVTARLEAHQKQAWMLRSMTNQ